MQRIDKTGDNSKKPSGSRSVYIATYGCQMNVRDSEVICGMLKNEGYLLADAAEDADIVLFNTCSVRQHAEDKVWSEVGKIVKQSKGKWGQSPKGGDSPHFPIIGIIGCMAQNYKEDIFQRAPSVDFVVGPSDIDKIPGIIKKVIKEKWGQTSESGVSPHFSHLSGGSEHSRREGGKSSLFEAKIWETDGQARPDEVYHTGFYEDKEHAFVVISEGCSNYCSYCVVPYVRGELRHRSYEAILKEIEEAIEKGITTITLLGQNVNAYINFIDLLKLVNQIKGLKEFSFITSHPKDTSADLFKAMAGLDKLKKYLHLPVQSGSDRILELMNRNYTRKYYLELVQDYRKIVKGGVLTTDIILGFPAEEDEDFQDTYDLVKEIGFNSAFIFKYSIRPHTEAAKMADTVSKEEKERRHGLILELQKGISKRNAQAKIKS